MEVKEESEQPAKQIKTQETLDPQEEEEDRISLLPDSLIIDEILSRLEPTKYAIRTGTLSKRWQHLWPSVSTLTFNVRYMQKWWPLDKPLPDFYTFVDKTLTQCRNRQLKNLNKFSINAGYDTRFKSYVDNWIHFAISCNVHELLIYLRYKEDEDQFVLEDDESFFVNSCFTRLHLGYCLLNPSVSISWNQLTDLTISRGELDDDLIANILSGSPLLVNLNLGECYGYSLLDITSKNVKNLTFHGYAPPEDQIDLDDIIEINAPFISSLRINGSLLLWKLLLRDVSSLVNVDLDYTHLGHCETTSKEEREEILKSFILRLPHVKELKIGVSCLTAFYRLEAKGFSFPSNLKLAEVDYPLYDTDDVQWTELSGSGDDDDSSDSDSSSSSVLETKERMYTQEEVDELISVRLNQERARQQQELEAQISMMTVFPQLQSEFQADNHGQAPPHDEDEEVEPVESSRRRMM